MIGDVCLLSCIRGSSGRVLVLSTVPIWLDVSHKYDDIFSLASELWSFCKCRRMRVNWGNSVDFLADAVSVISSGSHYFDPIKLCFFGSSFDLTHIERLRDSSYQISTILWKIGGDYMVIPNDIQRILFVSGRAASLMRNFYNVYNSGDSYAWNSVILRSSRFDRLRNYFHSLSCD
jgi:hypothetical protein